MKSPNIIGIVLGGAIAALSFLLSFVLINYMREYGSARFAAALLVAFIGVALGAAIFLRLRKLNIPPNWRWILLALLLIALIAPPASMFYPGKITYRQFGLTVYGIIPIPTLDIRVNASGVLWFRNKSHYVSAEEVKSLLTPGISAIVIGLGWDGEVRVDPAVKEIKGVEVHTLKTPEALRKFNDLKSQGKKVALIAHSTC